MIIFILILVNIPIYILLFRLIFEDMDEFYEAVKYGFIPDIVSLIKGKYATDFWLTLKMSFLIWGSIAVVAIEESRSHPRYFSDELERHFLNVKTTYDKIKYDI